MKRKDFIKHSMWVGATAFTLPALGNPLNKKTSEETLDPKIIRNDEGKTINFLGDIQTFKLTGKDTNGLFTLIEEYNTPGTMIPPHVHTKEDEIFKVLEGELELTVGDNTTVLKAGDLAFGPRNVPHSWKVIGDKNAKVILSVFPAGIENMFEELGALPPGPPDMEKVMEICARQGISFLK